MSTFTVSVTRIRAIEPIPGADVIELAVVGDYRSIIKKGQFQPGDLCAYLPEASMLPAPLVRAIGLEGKLNGPEKNRIKAVRLRGVLSQGICIPIQEGWVEGQDVAEILGVTKYEPPIPAHLQGQVLNIGTEYAFHYDIENIKGFPDVFIEGEPVVMSEKIHGCCDKSTPIDTLELGTQSISFLVDSKPPNIHVRGVDVLTGEEIYEKVEGFSRQPNAGNWFEIEFENGTILKLTGNHPVWLPREKCYRRVDLLTTEDIAYLTD